MEFGFWGMFLVKKFPFPRVKSKGSRISTKICGCSVLNALVLSGKTSTKYLGSESGFYPQLGLGMSVEKFCLSSQPCAGDHQKSTKVLTTRLSQSC